MFSRPRYSTNILINFDVRNIILISKILDVLGVAMNGLHMENARIFKAFCDETRLMALELLRSGEKCACVLLEKIEVGQSTLSHHMKILVESGIVNARKEGKWTYYSISEDGSKAAARLLGEITTVTLVEDDNSNERCCK
jgi:ArsR family transcriptional regulator